MRVQSGMARSCRRPMHQCSAEMQASLWTFQQRHCLSLMHFSCIGLVITLDTICNLVIREAPQSCSVSHITHSCRIYQNIWTLFILFWYASLSLWITYFIHLHGYVHELKEGFGKTRLFAFLLDEKMKTLNVRMQTVDKLSMKTRSMGEKLT